jgi:hypothetical protein
MNHRASSSPQHERVSCWERATLKALGLLLPRSARRRQLHEWRDHLDCTRAINGDLRHELLELARSAPAIASATIPSVLRISLPALATAMIASLLLWPTLPTGQRSVAVATAGVLLDTPSSQPINHDAKHRAAAITSLSSRAQLLANLMASSPLKDQIARRAGIAPHSLIAITPTHGPRPSPRSNHFADEASLRARDPSARVLELSVNKLVPVITARAHAPTKATATAIANAALTELHLLLTSAATRDHVPPANRLLDKPLVSTRSARQFR